MVLNHDGYASGCWGIREGAFFRCGSGTESLAVWAELGRYGSISGGGCIASTSRRRGSAADRAGGPMNSGSRRSRLADEAMQRGRLIDLPTV